MTALRLLLRPLVSTVLLVGAGTVFANDFLDASTLIKNATSANAGKETIVPLFREIDTNNDGYPEKLGVSFRVYDAGTYTKLFATSEKRFVVPPSPCNNPDFEDWDWDVEFVGDNSHTGAVVAFYNECSESGGGQFNEVFSTFVYVARTSGANLPVWAKTFGGWEAFSASAQDWDDDGSNEIVVWMDREIESGEQASVKIMNKSNGTIESNKIYKIGDF